MFSIIPQKDPDQSLRIRRFFMATASYIMWLGLVGYFYAAGFLRMTLAGLMTIYAVLTFYNIVVYLIFRFGWNKRYRDPSLTLPQMLAATAFTMLALYWTENARGVIVTLYLVTFLFGVFRLRIRDFLFLTLFAMGSYSLVVLLIQVHHPELVDIRVEIVQGVVLGAVLCWFSVVGGIVSGLRAQITRTNQELNKALKTIERYAIYDELTGAVNRRELFSVLKREKALADRGTTEFSVSMIDIDHFKSVNDTYGHLAGDRILVSVVQCVTGELRAVDTVARYGGEEFVIVMQGTPLAGAIDCAERVRRKVSRIVFEELPSDFSIHISCGVARYEPKESLESLLSRADAALYRAKQGGRNRVELWEADMAIEKPVGH